MFNKKMKSRIDQRVFSDVSLSCTTCRTTISFPFSLVLLAVVLHNMKNFIAIFRDLLSGRRTCQEIAKYLTPKLQHCKTVPHVNFNFCQITLTFQLPKNCQNVINDLQVNYSVVEQYKSRRLNL